MIPGLRCIQNTLEVFLYFDQSSGVFRGTDLVKDASEELIFLKDSVTFIKFKWNLFEASVTL